MQRNIFENLKSADRGRIVGLYQTDHSKAEIAHIMGCSRPTVALWIRKYEGEINNLEDHRKNNSRPQKTTPEENQEIIRRMDQNPFDATARVLRNRDKYFCKNSKTLFKCCTY